MRKKIVAGNWKMNKTLPEGIELVKEIKELITKKPASDVTVILAPPFIHLTEVNKFVDNKQMFLSAQNCASEASGAYTGEVSAQMIKSIGASYVIIGHSERRGYYHEDNAILAKKVNLALENGLSPIFCCGENLAERESGKFFDVIKKELAESLFGLTKDALLKVVIAYEPIWAIGTGKTASPDQAQEIHQFIRGLLTEKYGRELSENISILYGGSCNAKNAKELFSNHDVDGGLIGGASLKPQDFLQIIHSF